jgi:2,5-furandicarboxylate decarboxylase 1
VEARDVTLPDLADGGPQSIRSFLRLLESRGRLLRIDEPVDPVHEISAYLTELRRGPCVLFEDVRGSTLPVVGNALNSVERIALGLGVAPAELHATLCAALDEPVAPRIVDGGPCQDVALDDPDLAELPLPTFFEQETGPYITAGAIVSADSRTGERNWSIARLKQLERNTAFIGIAPNHHLAILARQAHARGEQLEIAVTIGNHPALLLAACLYMQLGEDELEIAGALLGAPVELVRCGTVALDVPAHAEIVLEGTLDPTRLVEEGAVSEFHGMYEHYKRGPVVTFHRMTRRRDALFQAIQPGYNPEHLLLGGVAIAAGLARELRRHVASVRTIAVTEGGCGRLHAIVALGDHPPGDARRAIFAAWAAVNLVKTVVVVDDDIDVLDPHHVEWAIATRMRAERDLVVVPESRADRAEPLEAGGVVTKLGIDATRREGDRADFTVAAPPQRVVERVRAALGARNATPGG